MAEVIYLLCAVTSVFTAALLIRHHRRTHVRLLLWSSICFAGFAVNNVLLFVDLVMLPQVDLYTSRSLTALAAVSMMVFGLVWESR